MLKSRARMMLEARVVNDAHFYKDGKIAVAVVTQELRRELHAAEDDMDDIGTLMRCIEGVEVGVLMKETPQGAIRSPSARRSTSTSRRWRRSLAAAATAARRAVSLRARSSRRRRRWWRPSNAPTPPYDGDFTA